MFLKDRKCTIKLSCVYPGEVLDILSNLPNSNSFGLDEIDTSILKLVKDEITPALTHIINLSIQTKKFPDSWKDSKIVPLHKKDDHLDPKNYRPVAINSILSKVLEKVIAKQMSTYLEVNNFIQPSHHAYGKDHITSTAVNEMLDT